MRRERIWFFFPFRRNVLFEGRSSTVAPVLVLLSIHTSNLTVHDAHLEA